MKPIQLLAAVPTLVLGLALAPLAVAQAEPIVIDHVTVIEGTGRAPSPT